MLQFWSVRERHRVLSSEKNSTRLTKLDYLILLITSDSTISVIVLDPGCFPISLVHTRMVNLIEIKVKDAW